MSCVPMDFLDGRGSGMSFIGLLPVPHKQEVSGFKEPVIRNFPFGLAFLLSLAPYVGLGCRWHDGDR